MPDQRRKTAYKPLFLHTFTKTLFGSRIYIIYNILVFNGKMPLCVTMRKFAQVTLIPQSFGGRIIV